MSLQHNKYQVTLAAAKLQNYNRYPPSFQKLLGKVSTHALDIIAKEHLKYLKHAKQWEDELPIFDGDCTGVISTTLGIMCLHMVEAWFECGEPNVEVTDILPQWWLLAPSKDANNSPSEERTQEPLLGN